MTRVGGTSQSNPVGGAEKRPAEKPPAEGEFDQVMEQHGDAARQEAAKPQVAGRLRRSFGGGAGGAGGGGKAEGGAEREGQGPIPGGRAGKGAGAGGAGGTAAGPLAGRGPGLAGDASTAAQHALGASARREPTRSPELQGRPGSPAAEQAGSATGGRTNSDRATTAAGDAGLGHAGGLADGAAVGDVADLAVVKARSRERGELASGLPGADPFTDSDSSLESAAPNPASLPSVLPSPTLNPVAPVEAPKPPTPAGDPALVREVAQKVLAGIETHMVAGRTQVELGLDLGTLGQAQVELSRLPDEGVKIVFRLETADAQQAVSRNLPELVHALEQKGMAPQIDLRRGDGSPMGGDQQGRQAQQGQDHRQGRSRGEYVAQVEEEG